MVNCVMGWSRSASVVAAYLVMKHKMKATKVRGAMNRTRRNILGYDRHTKYSKFSESTKREPKAMRERELRETDRQTL